MSVDEMRRWLPDGWYYDVHVERLASSFQRLPALPKGFSCLCVGSWGAEAPYLTEVLGAGRVVCVRAPDAGVPKVQASQFSVPASTRPANVEVYALNLETDELPPEVSDFDLCLAWEVLEHLCHDPPFFVWQAIRSLKIGGYLSLTTPNALWHYYTTAQLSGTNALGLKLQPHIPYATHWRLYSPKEVSELAESMGCKTAALTTFLKTEPFSLKSRFYLMALEAMRRNSGNGDCSIGQVIYCLSRKEQDRPVNRPHWLFPPSRTGGRTEHLA